MTFEQYCQEFMKRNSGELPSEERLWNAGFNEAKKRAIGAFNSRLSYPGDLVKEMIKRISQDDENGQI